MDQSTNNNNNITEEVLVLYGSQTGNSEGAAQEICSLIPTKLSSSTTSRVMHLDDFLEVEKAKWTKLVVIVCSSYGVGQAPIGARKFRELCDELLLRSNEDKSLNFLQGVHFALLGLGDSHYTTYFQNPTTIHKALTSVGAVHVGELGKADASGTDDMEQSKVIERWINNIWKDLNKVIATTTDTTDLGKARDETWGLCLDLFPDWKPTNYASMATLYVPLVGILLSDIVSFLLQQ